MATIKGQLSKEKYIGLLKGLSSLYNVDITKVNMQFSVDKGLYINSLNNTTTVCARLLFDKCLFDGFELDNFTFSVSDLKDFISVASVFNKCDKVDIKIEDNICYLSNADSIIEYIGADSSRIKNGKDGSIKDDDILFNIKCDNGFITFINGINALPNAKHIIFKSDILNGNIVASISDKSIKSNSFNKKIAYSGLSKEFKVVFDKQDIRNVIDVDTNIKVTSKLLDITKEENLYNIEYLVLAIN